MNRQTLVSVNEFEAYRPIGKDIDAERRIRPYILEAQNLDLRPILGDKLLDRLFAAPADPKIVSLMTYVRPVLILYSYARFVENQNVVSASFGIVTKRSEFSDPVSDKTMVRIAGNARSSAAGYAQELVSFITSHLTDYPEYSHGCAPKRVRRRIGLGIAGARSRRFICNCTSPCSQYVATGYCDGYVEPC